MVRFLKQNKFNSKIDYQKITNPNVTHYINFNKYNSDKENWVSLENLFSKDFDFLDLLFLKLTGKEAKPEEKRLLLRTLMLVSMGTGCHTPSVFVPKLIASTTKNKEFAIINGLIGGLSTIGTHHLGSVVSVMKTFEFIKKESNGNIKYFVKQYVKEELNKGNNIHGFGHPVYRKDPRPDILFNEIKNTHHSNEYILIFSYLKKELSILKDIHPNIDASLALSYLCLGFEPEQGIYLSFIGRSLNMVCHILEELPKKPFSFLLDSIPLEDKRKNIGILVKRNLIREKDMIRSII